MEEKRFKSKQRPSRYFSVKQKHEIINAYLEGSHSKQQIWYDFTGEPVEKGQILKFMRQLGYLDEQEKKKPLTFFMENKPNKKKPIKDTVEDIDEKSEIIRLKRELEESKIREEYYRRMIEMAEKELRIDIRKKSSTK